LRSFVKETILLTHSLVNFSHKALKLYCINQKHQDLLQQMSQLTLNLTQGSISFSFTTEAATKLQQEISLLMNSLKVVANKTSGNKPTPQKPMEYRYAGDVFVEVFCNPNIYPSPFAAKILLTIRDDRIRLTSEAELPRLIEDLERYLEENRL
jgi:virulence-associated protein VapD